MTLLFLENIDIDNFNSSSIDNYDNVRERMMSFNKTSLRTVLMSSSEVSVDYHTRIEHLNNVSDNKETKELTDSFWLSYMISEGQGNQVSKVADSGSFMEQ